LLVDELVARTIFRHLGLELSQEAPTYLQIAPELGVVGVGNLHAEIAEGLVK
jgi:hypothetical protein